MITRRDLLKMGLGAAALCATGNPLFAAAKAKKVPIALQLYSLRGDKRPFPEVLKAVAEIGYDGVEFAGYHNFSGEALRKILDDNGLKAAGTHTGLKQLDDKNFNATVELHQALGAKFVNVPGMPESMRNSVDAIKSTAEKFNAWADKLAPFGLYIGYHAHGGDFKMVDGKPSWDRLFEATKPEVVMQLDVGNCLMGGGDPYATLKKFPGRTKSLHVKEHSPKRNAPICEGEVDWKKVFDICETVGGTEWYVVEQEQYRTTPIASVTAGLNNLRKMGK